MTQVDNRQHRATSILSSQITATFTVGLVLLMLGIVALMSIAARNISDDIQRSLTVTAVISEDAAQTRASEIGTQLKTLPAVQSLRFVSADDVLQRWNSSGLTESLTDSINPFLPEWEITLNPGWSNADSVSRLCSTISGIDGIEEVTSPMDADSSLFASIHTARLIMIIVAAALLLISFVLIANTVRLSIHSRRFSINTMTLVGATPGYIRRPFILGAIGSGLIAALCAVIILAPALWYMFLQWPAMTSVISFTEAAIVLASLFVIGALICGIAAAISASKYLRSDYDSIVN